MDRLKRFTSSVYKFTDTYGRICGSSAKETPGTNDEFRTNTGYPKRFSHRLIKRYGKESMLVKESAELLGLKLQERSRGTSFYW